jgi:hypothetical protein
MAEDTAVLDAPVLDTPVVDTPVDDTPVVSDPVAPVADVEGDNRTLPAWIKNLKAADPSGYAEARKDFFSRVKLEEKIKGFDIDAARPWLEEKGGIDGITQAMADLETKASEYDQLTQALNEGSPALIQKMIDSSPEGFSKLAPQIDSQWQQADPEGWTAARAATFDATINQAGLPLHLERADMLMSFLAQAVQGNQQAEQILAQLQANNKSTKDWTGSFKQLATAQPKTTANQPDKGAQQWQQEKAKYEQERFQSKVEPKLKEFRTAEIDTRAKEFIAKEPDNADKRQILNEHVERLVISRLNEDKKLQASLASFVQKGDADGFIRLITSREKAAIEDIAPKEARKLYGQLSAAPAPKAPTVQRTVTPRVATENKFDAIWSR